MPLNLTELPLCLSGIGFGMLGASIHLSGRGIDNKRIGIRDEGTGFELVGTSIETLGKGIENERIAIRNKGIGFELAGMSVWLKKRAIDGLWRVIDMPSKAIVSLRTSISSKQASFLIHSFSLTKKNQKVKTKRSAAHVAKLLRVLSGCPRVSIQNFLDVIARVNPRQSLYP